MGITAPAPFGVVTSVPLNCPPSVWINLCLLKRTPVPCFEHPKHAQPALGFDEHFRTRKDLLGVLNFTQAPLKLVLQAYLARGLHMERELL